MNKKIIILIIIIIILLLLVGLLYFIYIQKKLPWLPININKPVAEEQKRIPADEMASLLKDIEKLNSLLVNSKLNFLEQSLPFNYDNQEFTTIDQVKQYIAGKHQQRDDFANNTTFTAALTNFIFSQYFSTPNSEQFLNLDNYAYYKKFKNECPQILSDNLAKAETENFKLNIPNIGASDRQAFFSNDLNYCLAIFDKDKCNSLQGEDSKGIDEIAKTVSKSESCKMSVEETFMLYYYLLSPLSCDQIDSHKISSLCAQKGDYCQQACRVFKRQITDLNFVTDPFEKAEFQSYLNKSTDICESLSTSYKDEAGFIRKDCKWKTEFLLAVEQKNIEKIKALSAEKDKSLEPKEVFMIYMINNLDKTGPLLDKEVTNGTYNFKLAQPDFENSCKTSYLSSTEKICPQAIKSLEDLFKAVANLP